MKKQRGNRVNTIRIRNSRIWRKQQGKSNRQKKQEKRNRVMRKGNRKQRKLKKVERKKEYGIEKRERKYEAIFDKTDTHLSVLKRLKSPLRIITKILHKVLYSITNDSFIIRIKHCAQ